MNKEKLPKVTIVTPSYNQGSFLESTIKSVISQDYPNFEYIIIDGRSEDESVSIIEKYSKFILYWTSEKDNGQSSAINKGFKKGTGELLMWINSDDILLPGAISTLVNCFLFNDYDIIYGNRLLINQFGIIKQELRYPSFSKTLFKLNTKLPQETCMFKREIFEKVGGLDENLHFTMDTDLWLKCIIANSKFHHLDVPLGIYRVHKNAKSTLNFYTKQQGDGIKELRMIELKYLKYFFRMRLTRKVAYRIDQIRLISYR